MVRTLNVVTLVLAVACILATPASAQQCPFSQPFGHAGLLGVGITGCNDSGPVSGFAYAVGTTATSGNANIVCEQDGEDALGATGCIGAGGPGDGTVLIDGNWGNVGVTGCPNGAGAEGVGRNVIVVRDNSGANLVLSVGYSVDFGGYLAEFAHRDTGELSCRNATGGSASRSVDVRGVNKGGDTTTTTVTVDAVPVAPTILSDCDPDSTAVAFGIPTCTEGSLSVAPGRLLSRVGACDGRDLSDLRTSAWTPFTGSASFPSGSCLFLGATSMIQGTESTGVVGAVAISGNLAARPELKNVRARQAGGDVVVSFETTSEIGLLSLGIYTKSGRLISDVSPKGQGAGAVYSVPTKRGAYKSERELYVVAVTSEGRITSDVARY